MLRAHILIDLPSAETDRPLRPVEWVRALFGARVDARSGHEELTVSAWSLLLGLRDGFAAAGVTNAVSLIVDGTPIYADTVALPDDLDLLVHVAQQSGVLERTFQEMRLVLTTERLALHFLFEVAILRQVVLGESELRIEVSARPQAPQPGESRAAWEVRVASLARRQALEPVRLEFDRFIADLVAELARVVDGAAVSTGPTTVSLRREWTDPAHRATVATWRPVPASRVDADEDPFSVYYDDPDWATASLLLCDALELAGDERHPLFPA